MINKLLQPYKNDGSQDSNNKPLCLVAGKSGGHILPCLAFGYRTANPCPGFIFFATQSPLDYQILQTNKEIKKLILLPFGAKSYATFIQRCRLPFDFGASLVTSFWYLARLQPSRVINTGGAVSFPVCLAARMLNIPIDLYELNVVPGKAVTVIARFATNLYACFAETARYFPTKKVIPVAYPVRFSEEERAMPQTKALKILGLLEDKKTMFIIGGSQGSVFLNTLIKTWLLQNPSLHNAIQIIHQVGDQNKNELEELYRALAIPAYVFTYTNSVATCYAAADLIICRSGAGTLFELLFFNKSCITIPLQTTYTNHQLDNAQSLAHMHPEIITVMQQQTIDANPALFSQTVRQLLGIK